MIVIEVYWLIWLIRSLGGGLNQRNNGFGGLGMELYEQICNVLGGQLIEYDVYADWANYGITMPLGNYSLPETSARYLLPVNQVPRLLYWIIMHP